MKLHTENMNGNLHQVAEIINKFGWADYVVTMYPVSLMTVVVFKMPDDIVHTIRQNSRSYIGDPHCDDCKETYLG